MEILEVEHPAHNPLHPDRLLMPGLLLGIGMMLVAMLWASWLRDVDLVEAWYPPEANLPLELGIGIGGGATAIVIVWGLSDTIPAMARLREKLIRLLDLQYLTVWHALAFGLLAGIPEEILFRGAIQPVLGVLITSMLFGSLHAITRLYLVYAMLAGLLLGLLVEWRGDLWAATTAHFLYDAGLFILMARYVRSRF